MKKSLYLLIKPASSSCNLKCRYCFYNDIAEKREVANYGSMSEDCLRHIVKKAFTYAEDNITFGFQGGEPLMRGIEFFEHFIEMLREYDPKGVKTQISIQTNGTLIDEAWAEFFFKNKFLIGISLDGYKETHNLNRVDGENQGTFNHVVKSINLLKKWNVEFNILCVVTKNVARHANKVYQYLKNTGSGYIQFIPCLDEYGEQPGTNKYSLSPKGYGEFLNRIFDLWHRDILRGNYCSIRYFDDLITILKGYPPASCDMQGECSRGTVIEADGSVYPCDFYVVDEYRLGNVLEDDFETLIGCPSMDRFVETSRNITEDCINCRFQSICRGGCRRHKVNLEHGGGLENYFCDSYKTFFEYSLDRLIRISKLI